MPQEIAMLITGLIAGVFSGMFGIGGGVIIVPVLIVFLGFTPITAVATSLAALLLPVGVLAVIAYYRQGLIDFKSSALIAIGLLTTTIFGVEIALFLPPDTLAQVYGLFLIYVGWRFVEPRKILAARRGDGAAAQDEDVEKPNIPWYVVLLVGLVAGVFSGLFGIGGGAVIVPALVAILRYDQKLAVGTSLGALLLPVGLPGVWRYYEAGILDPLVAVPVAIGLLIGALGGARIALGLPSRTVKRMYGVFLWAVGLWFILRPYLDFLQT